MAAVAGKGAACWPQRASPEPINAPALAVGTLMNARGLMELIILNIGLQRASLNPTILRDGAHGHPDHPHDVTGVRMVMVRHARAAGTLGRALEEDSSEPRPRGDWGAGALAKPFKQSSALTLCSRSPLLP